jgi:hypothetical protein
MSGKTPIPAADPFRPARIAAAVLSALTLCMVGALAIDLAFQPTTKGHRTALRGIFQELNPPLVDGPRGFSYPPPWSRHDARGDERFSPLVPAALGGAVAGVASAPSGWPQ